MTPRINLCIPKYLQMGFSAYTFTATITFPIKSYMAEPLLARLRPIYNTSVGCFKSKGKWYVQVHKVFEYSTTNPQTVIDNALVTKNRMCWAMAKVKETYYANKAETYEDSIV